MIHVYDRATKKEARTIGEPGGGYAGPWRRGRLVRPASCVLDGAGGLWVTERRFNPKRITKWDAANGLCVLEKIGSERYGAPGCGMDEDDATHWMAHDAEWRYDPAKGIDEPLACPLDETLGGGGKHDLPPRVARTWRWARRGGKTYLIGERPITVIYERDDAAMAMKPVAAFASASRFNDEATGWSTDGSARKKGAVCAALDEAWRRTFPPDAKEKPADVARAKASTLAVWRDREGDGRFDADEIEFGPKGAGGTGYRGLFADGLDVRVGAYTDGEWHVMELAYPEWSVADAWRKRRTWRGRMPSGVGAFRSVEQYSAPGGWLVYTGLSPYMLGFAPSGEFAWCMKNPFPGVHGSQKAPLPRPGELQGVLFALGSAPCGEGGRLDAMAIKNNHGRIFFITTDGVYLDELFTDCRVAAADDETYIGGESFGGSFNWDKAGRRAVLTSGSGAYRWYEIEGLDKVRERTYTRRFTAREIVEAQEAFPPEGGERERKAVMSVPAAGGAGGMKRVASWDGGGGRSVALFAEAGDDALRLRFDVRDESPWTNNGLDGYEMFKTGDCVDFQFMRGKSPVRVMAFPDGKGGAAAVVYDFDGALAAVRGEKPAPRGFSSPWRTYTAKHVFFPEEVAPKVVKGDGSYKVEMSVPYAWISPDGARPRSFKGDAGAIFGDRDGTVNLSRVYWSNKATGLVNDVPGEMIPAPDRWGEIVVASASGRAPSGAPLLAGRLVARGSLVNPTGITATPYETKNPHGAVFGPGPAFDPKTKTLYASAGRGRIAALSLGDGKPEARYVALKGARPFDRFDSMALGPDGELYVLAAGDLFRIGGGALGATRPTTVATSATLPGGGDSARPLADAKKIASGVKQISRTARDGKLMCLMSDSTVAALSLADGTLAPYAKAVAGAAQHPCMLDWLPTGELAACVRHRDFWKYADGKAVALPPVFGAREVAMARGAIIGDDLWSLWGGTVKRYDARTFKANPGVVYGGASGYFIGRSVMNTEVDASGICALGGGKYAIHTPRNSAIYVLRMDEASRSLVELKRIGPVVDPSEVLLDDSGAALVDGLVWDFGAKAFAPPLRTITRMPRRAVAVLADGRVAIVTEAHGGKMEYACGRLSDGGLSRDPKRDAKPDPAGADAINRVPPGGALRATRPTSDDSARPLADAKEKKPSRPVATFVGADGGGKRTLLCAVAADGSVRKYAIDAEGHPAGADWYAEARLAPPEAGGAFEGAAALPDGRIVAAVGGRLAFHAPDGAGGWKFTGFATCGGAEVAANDVSADGFAVAAVDAAAGTLAVYAAGDGAEFRRIDAADGLAEPARVAIRNRRILVWERSAQRVRRFELGVGD